MAKSKKNLINKENMFKKIMPTSYIEKDSEISDVVDVSNEVEVSLYPGMPPVEEKKSEPEKEEQDKQMVHNLTESIVEDRINVLLKRAGNFCRCDICKRDMVLKAIEQLEPQYIYGTQDEINKAVEAALKQDNSGISAAVMKAFLHVRQHPSHEM